MAHRRTSCKLEFSARNLVSLDRRSNNNLGSIFEIGKKRCLKETGRMTDPLVQFKFKPLQMYLSAFGNGWTMVNLKKWWKYMYINKYGNRKTHDEPETSFDNNILPRNRYDSFCVTARQLSHQTLEINVRLSENRKLCHRRLHRRTVRTSDTCRTRRLTVKGAKHSRSIIIENKMYIPWHFNMESSKHTHSKFKRSPIH